MNHAVVLVDHGSRRASAHEQLMKLGGQLQQYLLEHGRETLVEIAHMEIAEPSIRAAIERCIERGAGQVTVVPCFLSRGRHVSEDVPALVKEAVAQHPSLEWRISPPLVELDGFVPLLASAFD